MIKKIHELWSEWGFEISIGLCILFLLLFGLFNKFIGKRGSYSSRRNILQTIPISSPHSSPPSSPHSSPPSSPHSSRGPRESKGEAECRRVLEQLFHRRFTSERPDFLRNPVTGGTFNLELDCYNSDMKLAVEYNGIQHYKFSPYFHKSREHFMNQKYRDDMKRRICKDEGITLIEVPYTVKIDDIKSFIMKACAINGYSYL